MDCRSPFVSEEVLVTALPSPRRLQSQLVIGQLVDGYTSVTRIPPSDLEPRHGGPLLVGDREVVRTLTQVGDDQPDAGLPGEVFAGVELVTTPRTGATIQTFVLTSPPVGAAWGWPGGRQLFPPVSDS